MATSKDTPAANEPTGDQKHDLHAIRMELQSEIAKTREFAIERADKARNGALGLLSIVFGVIGLLSYQNVVSTVSKRAEGEVTSTTKRLEETLLAQVQRHIDTAVLEFRNEQGDQLHPAAGTTKHLKAPWKPAVAWAGGEDRNRAIMHIDTASFGFSEAPIVLVSSSSPSPEEDIKNLDVQPLEAFGGSLTVQTVTPKGFDVVLNLKTPPLKPEGGASEDSAASANFYGWYFSWIAIGKTQPR